MADVRDRAAPCPYCGICAECAKGFQKVLELKNTGLVLYRHSTEDENVEETGGHSQSDIKTTEQLFVLQNTKDVEIKSIDVLPEMEATTIVSCDRCRKIIEHAQRLLLRVPMINKNDIMGICDHCKHKDQSCNACQENVKKFFASRTEIKETMDKKVRIWLSKVKMFLKDAKEVNKFGKERVRARSELRIDQINRGTSPRGARQMKVKDLFQAEAHRVGLGRSHPFITGKDEQSGIKLLHSTIEAFDKISISPDYKLSRLDLDEDDKTSIYRQSRGGGNETVETKKKKHVILSKTPPVPFQSEENLSIVDSFIKDNTIKEKPRHQIRSHDEIQGVKDFKQIFKTGTQSAGKFQVRRSDFYEDDILPLSFSKQDMHDKEKALDRKVFDRQYVQGRERDLDEERTSYKEQYLQEKEDRDLQLDHISRGEEYVEGRKKLIVHDGLSYEEQFLKDLERDIKLDQKQPDKKHVKSRKQFEESHIYDKEYLGLDLKGLNKKDTEVRGRDFKFYDQKDVLDKHRVRETESKFDVYKKEVLKFKKTSRPSASIRKYDSEEALFKKVATKIKTDELRRDFSFSFPHEVTLKKTHKQQKTSSELIQDTLHAKAEEERKKIEQERKKKAEEEERKRLFREEKQRLAVEKKERAEERKQAAEEKKIMEQIERKLKKELGEKEEIVSEKNGEKRTVTNESDSETKISMPSTGTTYKSKMKISGTKSKSKTKPSEYSLGKVHTESKQLKEPEQSKVLKGSKVLKQSQEFKEPTKPKEFKESKKPRELKEFKEHKESKEPREPKQLREHKEFREPKENKDPKEPKESKELKESKERKEIKELKDFKEPNESTELRDSKGSRELEKFKESTVNKEPKEAKVVKAKVGPKKEQDVEKAAKEIEKKDKDEGLKKEKEEQMLREKILRDQEKELKERQKAIELEKKRQTDEKRQKEEQKPKEEKPKGLDPKEISKAKQEAARKLKQVQDEADTETETPRHVHTQDTPTTKELNLNKVKVRKPSTDNLILQLVQLKQDSAGGKIKLQDITKIMTTVQIDTHKNHHRDHYEDGKLSCPMCIYSDLEIDYDKNMQQVEEIAVADIIRGQKICKYKPPLTVKLEEKEEIIPLLFQSKIDDFPVTIVQETMEVMPDEEIPKPPAIAKQIKNVADVEAPKGVIQYALSDRTFIDKGWTMLPTEKVVRKMNVYRMRPAHPEFDWFEHNRNKRLLDYDTGQRLAEFDDNGRGRWYYRNGRLALDYYDAEEINAQQRFVIYSNGEPDERGRSRPYTILATFDYLGNGVVFDHGGKIRLKYNQTEGIVLDISIGPVSHWKWHTLNDPPVLQQVMIDTQMAHKDPDILKMGGPNENKPRPDNEEMLAIEFDNFIKEKSKKLSQSFKPFQIKMKALKINEHFSLRVLDQANVYLIYRDGTTNLKLNIGMILDHKEIVDTDTAEVGEVSNNLERFPARTDSLAELQKSVAYAQRFERNRTERERRLRPTEPCASADKLTAAVSNPVHIPLQTAPTGSSMTTTRNCYYKCNRKPSSGNVYYNNRLF